MSTRCCLLFVCNMVFSISLLRPAMPSKLFALFICWTRISNKCKCKFCKERAKSAKQHESANGCCNFWMDFIAVPFHQSNDDCTYMCLPVAKGPIRSFRSFGCINCRLKIYNIWCAHGAIVNYVNKTDLITKFIVSISFGGRNNNNNNNRKKNYKPRIFNISCELTWNHLCHWQRVTVYPLLSDRVNNINLRIICKLNIFQPVQVQCWSGTYDN